MSKINSTHTDVTVFDTERLAGGGGAFAAKQDNLALLKRAVLANLLWEDIAYIDGSSVAMEIERLIPLCDAEEVYKLALESRLMQKLRHIPLFLASEMCKHEEHKKYVSKLLPQVITRADMLTDFLAIYWKDGKKPLCNQAKKGLAEAFHNFDEYRLAKYDRDAAIKLRDVMFICHPKAKDEQETELFRKVANRTLQVPETWEVMLSRGDDKKATWTKLITEKKLGGLAMLRNLRNMVEAGVDFEVVVEGINNLNGTMLLPFDYYKANMMAPDFSRVIEASMLKNYSNLPKLKGKTLLIGDVSGSMTCRLSGWSGFSRLDAAIAMTMLAVNQCEDCYVVCTAGRGKTWSHASERIINPVQGFGLAIQIYEAYSRLGYLGIFTRRCLKWCRNKFKDTEFERIIVFSDSQDQDRDQKRVPQPFGKHNYICDVSCETHGVNFQGVWTAEISGFSEHFLTYIGAMEGVENTFAE